MSNKKAAQIYVPEFPENVRMRKGMYIYNKEHQVQEFIDNSVDEGNAGYANAIAIVIKEDSIIIEDNGRGMPVQPHPDPKFKGKSQAEVAYTTLHAGGKFGQEDGYKTATGQKSAHLISDN